MTIIQKGELMGDLISRQAAIDIIEAGRLTKLIDAETAVNGLKNLPSVQPERKTGRWIGKYPVTSVCSECNYLIHDSKVKVFAYCPNCGADMRGDTT